MLGDAKKAMKLGEILETAVEGDLRDRPRVQAQGLGHSVQARLVDDLRESISKLTPGDIRNLTIRSVQLLGTTSLCELFLPASVDTC